MEPGWMLAFRFLGMGWAVVLSILFGLLAGLWLDQRVHTTPIFTIVGLLLGLGAAARSVYWMIRAVRPTSRNGDRR